MSTTVTEVFRARLKHDLVRQRTEIIETTIVKPDLLHSLLGITIAFAVSSCDGAQHTEDRTQSMTDPHQIETVLPPVAEQRPHSFTHHGITVEDPYHWLKDQSYPEVDDPDVLAYLQAENAYFESKMSPHEALKEALFEEIKGRQKQDDESVPWKDGDWLYQWKYADGAQYRTWTRKPVAGGEETVILDEVELADGLDYFRLGGLSVSPDGRYLAYSTDTDGSERFTMQIKDLQSGRLLPDMITETIGGAVWAAEGSVLLYLRVSEQWRPYQVRAHRVGEDVATDRVLYEEADESFFVGLGSTQSREYVLITAADHVTSEVRVLAVSDPFAEPKLVAARETGHEYELDHGLADAGESRWFIRTNDSHINFRIASAPTNNPQRENWQELIAGSDRHYIRGLTPFKNALVITGRVDGLDQVRIRDAAGEEHFIEFPEAAYSAGLGTNAEYAITKLRLGYESMVTPDTVFDYDFATRALETRKVLEIPSGYDASQYETVRLMAPARDGVSVPVSVVYKKGYPRDGSMPVHVYAYGAYGYAVTPSFSANRLSLLDRGYAYAIAHVRGGDDLGYQWYLNGKLTNRNNTFNDFIDVTNYLISEGFGAKGRASASGGSAGGELMGAIVNQAPELYGGVVAHVPFVDVLNTMLDTSLPLTPIEWPEWGNPIEDKEAFEFIRSYSPYDQVAAKAYPPLMVTAGLNDPRVTYWEPAKWVAKLRVSKTDNNDLIFKTNMGAGHGGKSGRFTRLYEVAEEYTFLLTQLGLEN